MPRGRKKKPEPTAAEQQAIATEAHHAAVAEHLPEPPDTATEFDPAHLEQLPPNLDPQPAPDTEVRVEAALQAAHVMRASQLDSPPEEQDGTHGPNRWAGVVRDSKQKLRIDKETVRKPGQPYLRVLISFPKDAKPNDEERKLLKSENFSFDGDSWGKELNGPNVLLAKQVVNQIYKMRGDDYQLFLG